MEGPCRSPTLVLAQDLEWQRLSGQTICSLTFAIVPKRIILLSSRVFRALDLNPAPGNHSGRYFTGLKVRKED
jgi:hypothetical protein